MHSVRADKHAYCPNVGSDTAVLASNFVRYNKTHSTNCDYGDAVVVIYGIYFAHVDVSKTIMRGYDAANVNKFLGYSSAPKMGLANNIR